MKDQTQVSAGKVGLKPADANHVGPDRWVNAVIETVVPLDTVTPDAGRFEKQEAAGVLLEQFMDALPESWREYVSTARWEDMDADGGLVSRADHVRLLAERDRELAKAQLVALAATREFEELKARIERLADQYEQIADEGTFVPAACASYRAVSGDLRSLLDGKDEQ